MEAVKINLENEAEIVERAKTDEAAFAILYDHYFPRIYAYIFKRAGNRETAEDILSMTFLRAFTNLKRYQSRGFLFGAWLYRIATNNLMDHYRKHKDGAEMNLDEASLDVAGDDGPEGFPINLPLDVFQSVAKPLELGVGFPQDIRLKRHFSPP